MWPDAKWSLCYHPEALPVLFYLSYTAVSCQQMHFSLHLLMDDTYKGSKKFETTFKIWILSMFKTENEWRVFSLNEKVRFSLSPIPSIEAHVQMTLR